MKTSNFDKLCWIILIALSFLLFTSCKTQQKARPCTQCPSYTSIQIPYVDTIVFNEVHQHFYFDEQYHCMYIESFTTIEIDTLYLEFHKTK